MTATLTPVTSFLPQPRLPVSEASLLAAINRHVHDFLFPGECFHSPDVDDMIRSEKLAHRVRERIVALSQDGVDATTQTLAELLPGLKPHEIPVTEADYEAY